MRTAPIHAGKEFEEQLSELAFSAHNSYEKTFVPKWPWNLVYVLPKGGEHKSGIILLDRENKTMYEGIVLETWKPFDRELMYTHESHCEHCLTTTTVHVEPSLKRGMHVIFPHWSGIPLPWLPEDRYRLVREENGTDAKSDIPGYIEYDTEKTDDVLYNMLYPKLFVQESQSREYWTKEVIKQLHEVFHITRINVPTRTKSGK